MNVRGLTHLPSVVLMSALRDVPDCFDQYLDSQGALPFLSVWLFIWGLAAMTMGTVLRATASHRERARLITFIGSASRCARATTAIVLFSFARRISSEGPISTRAPIRSVSRVQCNTRGALDVTALSEHHRKWMRWYLAVAFVLAAGAFVDVIRPATFSILPDQPPDSPGAQTAPASARHTVLR
jgi:hypothetical protein